MSIMDILTGKPGKRFAIYLRVSSEEQLDGYSLDAQRDILLQFVEARGGEIVKIYEDPARSGKNALRPEFQQMIRDAEDGVFDVIAVHKLDRFSRSLLDTLTYLKRLNDCDVAFVSATEQFDFTSAIGKVVLAILAAFAEWYLDNLANEVRKGKFQRAASGYHNGTLSFGYTTTRKLKERLLSLGVNFKAGTVDEGTYSRESQMLEDTLALFNDVPETAAVPDPFDATGVRAAFQMYSYGIYSDQDVANMLNDSGYRILVRLKRNPSGLFSKDTVEDILQNRFYIGEVSYGAKVKGKTRQWMKGQHQELISQYLFNRCQQVRAERAARFVPKPANRKRTYILSGVLICSECGKRWGGWYTGGNTRYRDMADKRRGQYCDAHIKSALAETLESQIEEIISSMHLPRNWRDRIEKLAQRPIAKQGEQQSQLRRSYKKQLERLQKLFTLGDISEESYLQQRNDINNKLDQLVPLSVEISDIVALGDVLETIKPLWKAATAEEKRKLVESLFTKVYVKDGVIKAVVPTGILWALLHETLIRSAGRTGFEPAIERYHPITA